MSQWELEKKSLGLSELLSLEGDDAQKVSQSCHSSDAGVGAACGLSTAPHSLQGI